MRRHEKPIKRVNPSGREVWVARYTSRDGKRRSAGTFKLQRDAQAAIDAAYDTDDRRPVGRRTVGDYFAGWLDRHPRTERTERSYRGRVRSVLDVEVDGMRLRHWALDELTRGHAYALVGHMLTEQGRAAKGAKGVVVVLSAMAEDAITDGHARSNPFRGVQVRASDRRVRKEPRRIRIWTWDQMHAFCAVSAAPVTEATAGAKAVNAWRAVYAEPMLRVLSDCGLRLGELLPLERNDLVLGTCSEAECRLRGVTGPHLHIRRTAHEGSVISGTKTDHGEAAPGRVAPVPPVLAEMLRRLPPRIDTQLLFPMVNGRLWREGNFYRRLWEPARERMGIDPTPHEFRHSWVSYMRAAGITPADVADAAGHTVETATKHYTHALRTSFEAMRRVVGE